MDARGGGPGTEGGAPVPEAFAAAVQQIRATSLRPEISLEEVPGPRSMAPWSLALSADVLDEAGDDVAEGRFVLLHDPAGQEGWDGPWRVVVLARCSPATEDTDDPLLADVAWSWLVEALDDYGLPVRSLGGTVTTSTSRSYGQLSARPVDVELEVRASFSPRDADVPGGVGDALLAWGQLLGAAAGLPPLPHGVVRLPRR
ncbi:Protein of unknown function [Quadrisphaera granulorum]|uniref:DUF3000 family protein n=1 Tax=Quadrisphaera granulorum TaxID=317664 RepID=A0A316A6C3_9ACTN|nr:DUF3000 domain-containing protein [Quadrisphaera granulorum]PWJ53476.1 Protein of unknown function (DUF3000) [Quadrisphaera granulorum]SZE96818.1 Protein of unknown function [Quadrisphaera granulorum]